MNNQAIKSRLHSAKIWNILGVLTGLFLPLLAWIFAALAIKNTTKLLDNAPQELANKELLNDISQSKMFSVLVIIVGIIGAVLWGLILPNLG